MEVAVKMVYLVVYLFIYLVVTLTGLIKTMFFFLFTTNDIAAK